MKNKKIILSTMFFCAIAINFSMTTKNGKQSVQPIFQKFKPTNIKIDVKESFVKIMEDAEQDFEQQMGEKIKDEGKLQNFKYNISLGGQDEIVLKTFTLDEKINTIYFRSIFLSKDETDKNKAKEIKKIFLEVAAEYESSKGYQIFKSVDAMQNNKTILKDEKGNQLVLFVETTNNESIKIFVYGKSTFKK